VLRHVNDDLKKRGKIKEEN